MRTFHIVGNWKMNQSLEEIKTFFKEFDAKAERKCVAGISSQAIHLPLVKELAGNAWSGSQNISQYDSGAYTGELSVHAVKELGCEFTLVGHSERRAIFKEDDKTLNEKTKKALELGLKVIFCVGETLEEREANKTKDIVLGQLKSGLEGISADDLKNVIVAYEPVWAIGTGKTASPEQAQEVHADIRAFSSGLGFNPEELIIQYGGSVKPANAEGLLGQPDIDGALVGGASLKGDSFTQLCQIADSISK